MSNNYGFRIESTQYSGQTCLVTFLDTTLNETFDLGVETIPFDYFPVDGTPQGKVFIYFSGTDQTFVVDITQPNPSPTPTVTPTITPTITQTPTSTQTPTPSVTSTITPTVTQTPTPTVTLTPTVTPTLTPSLTSSETPTPTVTSTLTPSLTSSETPTPTVTKTSTQTPTPSVTPTNTITPTITVTPTITPTITLTPTITPTLLSETQLLTNPDFDSGTTGWSATGGFGTWSFTSSNQVAVLNGVLYFTYVSRTVSQTVNVSSVISSANSFNGVINIKREENGPNNNDTYNFTLTFKNSSGATVITKTTGTSVAPLNYTDITLTLNRSEISSTFDTITTVDVQLTGVDAGFWNGNHGPWVDYIKLNVS